MVAAVAVALLAGACSPPRNLDAGLNPYSTDIVLGAQTKPVEPPPPIPLADPTPTFPSFIAPPPPPPPPPAATPRPPTTTTMRPPPPVEACPQASLFDIPDPAAPDVSNPPKSGVYPYRQTGFYKVDLEVQQELPPETERIVTNVVTRDDGTFSHDVIVRQFGATTTTTYNVLKPSGQPDLDGIYITRIVHERADGSVEAFTPAGAQGAGYGLRILPLPATIARSWSSVATDPIRGTSMRLEGLVKEASRVDACGVVVEGWASEVTIETRVFAKANPINVAATYIIAPQLGGLIVGDDVVQDDIQNDQRVTQESHALINSLDPVRPAPQD